MAVSWLFQNRWYQLFFNRNCFPEENRNSGRKGGKQLFWWPWGKCTLADISKLVWHWRETKTKICQCEREADCILCSGFVWWLRKYWEITCGGFFSILSIYTIVWLEEKAQMVRGGLELESFRISPARITRLRFLALCWGGDDLSFRIHVQLFFFHLACPCLKSIPIPASPFNLQLHCFLPTNSLGPGWESSPIESNYLSEKPLECFPLAEFRTNQVGSASCDAAGSSIPWASEWLRKGGGSKKGILKGRRILGFLK